MSTDRLIFVLGTPSGGTSCVAGILHHLGVDMGNPLPEPGVRGYVTHEDRDVSDFIEERDGAEPAMIRQRLDLRAYLAHRRELQPSGRLGVKGSALWWLDDTDPASLPLDIVRVLGTWKHPRARINASSGTTGRS